MSERSEALESNSIDDCRLVDLPRIDDARGSLSFIEGSIHIPFDIARIYYMYRIPEESRRGRHAHKNLSQLIIAISGSYEVVLDDGLNSKRFLLNRPDQGLYVCPMIWRDLEFFSSDAVCMVLASDVYDTDDYLVDYEEFRGLKIQ